MGFRINSTGRKRIHREHVRIRLNEAGASQPPTFTADIQLPADLRLDPSAKIYVEPYVKSSSMRFDFGTVGQITPPANCVLSDIDAGAAVLFRVKVVDETEEIGRILASANGIRPENDADGDDRRPLLPVRSANLGEEIWRLDVDKDAGPTLVVNSRVPDLIEALKRDVYLQGAIYPEVVWRLVREVFGRDNDSEEDGHWVMDWKAWIASQLGREIAEYEVEDAEALELLADEVAASFASKNRFVSTLIATRQHAG
ncbi:MAG: hypothetical protein LC137_03455 [Burkholderiales bacterium]|nr:hypothetical protein [Burkholderiales bacterium]